MTDEQREHPDGPSADGPVVVPRTGGTALAENVGTHDDDVDREGAQGVLECVQGVHLEVRRDLNRLLTDTPAGPELAALVQSLDLELLDAHDRIEVVAAAGRVVSWAHAVKARAAAAVDRHWTMSTPRTEPIPEGMHVIPERIAPAALALRLQASPRETTLLIQEGRCYDGILAETGDALARGALDPPRARVIARRLHDQPALVALQVEAEVLGRAEGRTSHQVKQDVERALLRVDAEHAADRHVEARSTRSVSRPQVRDDGMAALWVVLPAVDAVRIDRTLEAAARTARAAGDPRTLEQLRADGLCDLVLHRGCMPTDAFGVPVVLDPHTTPDAEASGDAEPFARRTDDSGGSGEPDNSDTSTSTSTDSDSDSDSDSVLLSPASAGSDEADAGAPGIGASDGGRVPAALPTPQPHPRTQVLISIPMTTMMGIDDGPAELAGYGPLDPVQARALAWGGTWRRMLTDPLDGTVLDLGRTRYRPTAALAEHVRRRDRTCVWPGCSLPADLTDLDHNRDYHRPPDDGGPPGSTSHDNLAPLCRNHHRLKTEAGFRLHHVSPGTYVWTDPSGHRYAVRPGADGGVVPLPAEPPPF